MKVVGARLRELRKGVGFSQTQIAEKFGATQSAVNRYEIGESEAKYKMLLEYADYFDVSMDYIFGRTDQPQGRLYDFKPNITESEEMRKFIDMCFDPQSPMSGKLKDTLLQMMMKGGGAE